MSHFLTCELCRDGPAGLGDAVPRALGCSRSLPGQLPRPCFLLGSAQPRNPLTLQQAGQNDPRLVSPCLEILHHGVLKPLLLPMPGYDSNKTARYRSRHLLHSPAHPMCYLGAHHRVRVEVAICLC